MFRDPISKRKLKSANYSNLNEEDIRELMKGDVGIREDDLYLYIKKNPNAFKVPSPSKKMKGNKYILPKSLNSKTPMSAEGESKMITSLTSDDLYRAARNAKTDLDKAKNKEDIIAVFKKHMPFIGYKSLGKMLVGYTPEDSVRKWANNLDKARER